jgi:ABC-type branched-subunit amino acid transport system substrate-binding protein
MIDAGFDDVPMLGWDGMRDGSGEESGSFIALAGDAAAGTYASRPSVGTIRAEFERRYQEEYGELPEAQWYEYTGAAYACAEIILQALTRLAATGPSADGLREAVRAAVTDPDSRWETVLGTVGFDENGDSTQQVVTFYRIDPSAANGAGDWVVVLHRDFGAAD